MDSLRNRSHSQHSLIRYVLTSHVIFHAIRYTVLTHSIWTHAIVFRMVSSHTHTHSLISSTVSSRWPIFPSDFPFASGTRGALLSFEMQILEQFLPTIPSFSFALRPPNYFYLLRSNVTVNTTFSYIAPSRSFSLLQL